MDENIIGWNLTNWVTVVLMAAIGYSVMAVIESIVLRQRKGGATQ